MLSDQLRQLLTAYVDGELTNRQRRAVQRLLRRSAEARTLLRKLQEDAVRLRALPRQHLDGEFSARVVVAVRQGQAQARRREAVRQASFPLWAGFAAAAAALLAVGLGSYFYFAQSAHDAPQGDPVVENRQPSPEPTPDRNSDPGPDHKNAGGTAVADTQSKSSGKPNELSKPEELPNMPVVVGDKPKDPVGPGDVITQETPQPGMEMFLPHVVKPPFSLIEDVREIKVDKLRKDFGEETALRIELPCHDTVKGFRRLQTALKDAGGITLAIDAAAQNRLDKPRLRSNYVILVEELTAEDLVRVLARVGSDDKKAAEAKPKPDGQFSKVVVNRLSDIDLKELSAVLHVEAGQLQSNPEKAGKGTDRLALAVTYNPEQGRPKAGSPEVKRYMENRKPARKGVLQVLLVLREA
jgi:hypothetical protein